MFARVTSGGVVGVDPYFIYVEVDLSNGVQSFDIVGLPETSVRESKVRVRSALRNAGFDVPNQKTTINLAPADVPKSGSAYDFPIAAGIVASGEPALREALSEGVLVAELSLDGRLRPVRGVLAVAIHAHQCGRPWIMVSKDNAEEASAVEGLTVFAPSTLAEAISHLRGERSLEPHQRHLAASSHSAAVVQVDMADVRGQEEAKRALLVAAAGGHNVLLMGAPGCGKTMLVRRLPSILPELSDAEALETSRIYSVCGLLHGGLLRTRPLRAPHHTCSPAALVGGGAPVRPGEVSLAHNGVLFLDELPEFGRIALECLRQPMEERRVHIARAKQRVEFPASALVVAAANPCPCGYLGSVIKECRCSGDAIRRYRGRLSGPLLDRIDLHFDVPSVPYDSLEGAGTGLTSARLREWVEEARQRQYHRNGPGRTNSALDGKALREACQLDERAHTVLRRCVDIHGMSARGLTRALRLARTFADLAGSARVEVAHVAEALSFRSDAARAQAA
jgi:magnesium chelatase family protein